MPAQDERRNVKTAAAIDQRRRQKQMFERQKQTRSDRVKLARMLGQDAADAVVAAATAPSPPPQPQQPAALEAPTWSVAGAGADGPSLLARTHPILDEDFEVQLVRNECAIQCTIRVQLVCN